MSAIQLRPERQLGSVLWQKAPGVPFHLGNTPLDDDQSHNKKHARVQFLPKKVEFERRHMAQRRPEQGGLGGEVGTGSMGGITKVILPVPFALYGGTRPSGVQEEAGR